MIAMEIYRLTIKVYNFPVVDKLNLEIREQENVELSLPKGCEDTVFRVLCGLELPDSGEIWIYNLPPRQALLRGLMPSQTLTGQILLKPFLIELQVGIANISVTSSLTLTKKTNRKHELVY